MSHEKVYEWFESYFPQFSKHIVEWFPNGKDSIRVRRSGNQDFIFTFHGIDDWCFETVDSFIKKLKGEREM